MNHAVYCYALVNDAKPPNLRRLPPGLPETGPVRLLEVSAQRWLVVADAPLPRYDAASIERGLRDLDWVAACGLAHEAVVEHFASAPALVPMKLFTLFASDARAKEHVERLPNLDTVLARIRGTQEWGVRINLDLAKLQRGAKKTRQPARSGREFLERKLLARDGAEEAAALARGKVDSVYAGLARLAKQGHRRVQADAPGDLLLDAVFLVPERGVERFRAAAERLVAPLAGSVLTLSGPWPAYHFIEAEA